MEKAKISASAKQRLFKQSLKAVELLEKRLQECSDDDFERVKQQLKEERAILLHFAK